MARDVDATHLLYRWREFDGAGKLRDDWLFADWDGADYDWQDTFNAVHNDTTPKYDTLGKLLQYSCSATFGTGASFTYSEPFGFLTADAHATYQYDNYAQAATPPTALAGNRTKRIPVAPQDPVETYVYNKTESIDADPLDRLYIVKHDGVRAVTYDYDAAGNLTAKHESATVNAWETSTPTVKYDWNERNQLRTVTFNAARPDAVHQIDFEYDPIGRLCYRKVTYDDASSTESTFVYDGDLPAAEIAGNGTVLRQMVWDTTTPGGIGGLLLLRTAQGEFRPAYDFRGNVIALFDADGQVAERYEYDGFGRTKVFSPTGTDITADPGLQVGNPFRFATKRFDTELGLCDFGFRWYDPDVGRFVSPDPLGFVDGPNRYLYVAGDPVQFVDPWGLCTEQGGGSAGGSKSKKPFDPWMGTIGQGVGASVLSLDWLLNHPPPAKRKLPPSFRKYPNRGRRIQAMAAQNGRYNRAVLRGRQFDERIGRLGANVGVTFLTANIGKEFLDEFDGQDVNVRRALAGSAVEGAKYGGAALGAYALTYPLHGWVSTPALLVGGMFAGVVSDGALNWADNTVGFKEWIKDQADRDAAAEGTDWAPIGNLRNEEIWSAETPGP